MTKKGKQPDKDKQVRLVDNNYRTNVLGKQEIIGVKSGELREPLKPSGFGVKVLDDFSFEKRFKKGQTNESKDS